jgi:site-specific recombinase XerD
VTHLRKMMLEELQLRNYAENTIRHYIRAVEEFARHFHCSPDRLGPRHVREYQAQLFQKRKLSANSIGQHLAALRFLYIKTLRRPWSLAETPYPKKVHRLPTILSREEADAIEPIFSEHGQRNGQSDRSSHSAAEANSLKTNGGPARIRTWDQRIMSPLL